MTDQSGLWREPTDPNIVRYKALKCHACGHTLDAAAAVQGQTWRLPRPGDFVICIACAEPAVFDLVLGAPVLRVPTPAEREECMILNADTIDKLKRFNAQRRLHG